MGNAGLPACSGASSSFPSFSNKSQFAAPSEFACNRMFTSLSSSSWTTTGRNSSDQSPTLRKARPTSTISGSSLQSAFDRLVFSISTVGAGRTSSSKFPSIANFRPVMSLIAASSCGLSRLKSRNRRYKVTNTTKMRRERTEILNTLAPLIVGLSHRC